MTLGILGVSGILMLETIYDANTKYSFACRRPWRHNGYLPVYIWQPRVRCLLIFFGKIYSYATHITSLKLNSTSYRLLNKTFWFLFGITGTYTSITLKIINTRIFPKKRFPKKRIITVCSFLSCFLVMENFFFHKTKKSRAITLALILLS